MNPESDKPDTQKHGLFFFGLPTFWRPTTEEMPRSAQEVRIQNLECVLYEAQHRVAERGRQITMMAERQKDLEEALAEEQKRHEVTQEYLDNVRKYETLYRIQQAECAPLRDLIKRLQAEIERLNLALKQKPNEDLQSVKRALSAEQDYADRIGRILNDREESLDACHRKIEEQAKELEVLWKQRDDMLDRLCAVESALYAGVPPAKGAI